VRSDYEVKARIVLLFNSRQDSSDVIGSAEMEIEDIQLGVCTVVSRSLGDSDDGDVAIRYDRGIEDALNTRRGFIFVAGKLKGKRMLAGSVLLNDVAVHHPDGLYLATHGSLVNTSINSVVQLDRRGFQDTDAFIERVLNLGPDAITLLIRSDWDLQEALHLEGKGELLVICVTSAKTRKELETLLDSFSPTYLAVVAE
jgi:hypothetical protein